MQVNYKDIIIDVNEGTKVIELLNKEILNAEEKVIACKFNNKAIFEKIKAFVK